MGKRREEGNGDGWLKSELDIFRSHDVRSPASRVFVARIGTGNSVACSYYSLNSLEGNW